MVWVLLSEQLAWRDDHPISGVLASPVTWSSLDLHDEPAVLHHLLERVRHGIEVQPEFGGELFSAGIDAAAAAIRDVVAGHGHAELSAREGRVPCQLPVPRKFEGGVGGALFLAACRLLQVDDVVGHTGGRNPRRYGVHKSSFPVQAPQHSVGSTGGALVFKTLLSFGLFSTLACALTVSVQVRAEFVKQVASLF